MTRKIDKGIQFLGDKSRADNNLLDSIKKTKKANLTAELVYKNQLTTIPSVSYKTADIIISYYPKLNDLLTNLGKLEQEERINIIKNLKDKSNKGKKIGIKVGENIDKYLFY